MTDEVYIFFEKHTSFLKGGSFCLWIETGQIKKSVKRLPLFSKLKYERLVTVQTSGFKEEREVSHIHLIVIKCVFKGQ